MNAREVCKAEYREAAGNKQKISNKPGKSSGTLSEPKPAQLTANKIWRAALRTNLPEHMKLSYGDIFR